MQSEFMEGMVYIVSDEFDATFSALSQRESAPVKIQLFKNFKESFETTSTMDAAERMVKIAAASTPVILDYFTRPEANLEAASSAVLAIPQFRSKVAKRLDTLLDSLRREYLSGQRGAAPAARFLNKTRPAYEFVRLTLGIKMHGMENYDRFANGLGADDVTTGENVSLIHEAIRDGQMQAVVSNLFSS
jgi:phenylalanine ammonia-lyase